MRIAQIAPLHEAVPPRLYGGTERVISWLTEELVALGHDVTLFASGDSQTKAKLEAMWPVALRLDGQVRDRNALQMAMLETVFRRVDEFDILHFHLDYYPFSMMSRLSKPHLTTMHGRLDMPEHQQMFATFDSSPVISISDSQRRPVASANWIDTIHHGLPVDLLQPQPVEPSYLAFLGRIAVEKRVDRAIRISELSGVPLKIAAKVDADDKIYFDGEVAPLLEKAPQVEFVGEICDDRKPPFLGAAKALLVPIDWPEPFGLVMIEAMACGTPTIAYNRGSVPEVIEHGVTGFIVENEEEAVAAVHDLPRLSRSKIRERFEQRFTSRRMAEQYVDVYWRMIGGRRVRPHLVTA